MSIGVLKTRRLYLGQPINWASPLNRGLVSRWQVTPEWAGGGKLFDFARFNHGTLTNGPAWTGGGRPGGFGALSLDGSDDYVSTTLPTIGTGDYALSCWAMPTTNSGNHTAIGAHDNPFYLEIWAGTFASAFYEWKGYSSSGASGIYSGVEAVPGRWDHILLTRVAGTNAIYVNGRPGGTESNSESISSSTMYFGSRAGLYLLFPGSIDDIRLWVGRGMTANDAMAVYQDSRRGSPATLNWYNPTKYFFFDAGGGPATYSASIGATLGALAGSVSATFTKPTYNGAIAASLAPTTAALSATFTKPTYAGTIASSLAPLTAAISATVVNPTYDADIAATLGPLTAALSATFAENTFTASVDADLGPLTASLAATFVKPTYSAAVAAQLAGMTAALSAAFTKPSYSAAIAGTLGPLQVSVLATFDAGNLFTAAIAATLGAMEASGVAIVTAATAGIHYCGRAGIARPYRGNAGTITKHPGDAGLARPYRGFAGTNPCHN